MLKMGSILVVAVGMVLAMSVPAGASVIVYDGFNYGSTGDNATLNGKGGTTEQGLAGTWSGSNDANGGAGTGTYKYRTAGLAFSDLPVSSGSGCAEIVGNSHAYRPLGVNQTGTIWGSYLFKPITAINAVSQVADFYVTKSSGFSDFDANTNFGVAPKNYDSGSLGDVRLGGNTNPPSVQANSGGTGLAQGTTYLALYRVNNLVASGGAATTQTVTSWFLNSAQYDNFKAGGLTEAELNAASQGSGSTNVTQRTTLTATQKASFSTSDFVHMLAYTGPGDYQYDEVRVSNASLNETVGLSSAGTVVADLRQNYNAHTPVNGQTTVGKIGDNAGGSWNLYDSGSSAFTTTPPADLTALTYSTAVSGNGVRLANAYQESSQTNTLPGASANALIVGQPAPAADELDVHPGNPTGQLRKYLWIKWTAGVSGPFNLSGWVHNISTDANQSEDGVLLSILSDSGTVLGTYTAPAWYYSSNGQKVTIDLANLTMTAGQSLYFVVGERTNNNGDNTGLSLTLTQVGDIPEPATMALLGLAATGLGGYIRRRRAA